MSKKNKSLIDMFPKVSGGTKPKKVQEEKIDMRLAQIKNGYMYNSDEPEKTHTYVVYTDKASKEVRAIPTTHLYIKDNEKMEKVRKGVLRKVKFDGYETPSGVENYYYNTDAKGKPIDLNNKSIIINKKPISNNQANVIKNFAKKLRKR